MQFDEYHEKAMKFAVYCDPLYPALGLAAESGEFLSKLSKVARLYAVPNIWGTLTLPQRKELVDELGDVLWMLTACAEHLNVSLDNIASSNLAKLTDRAARGVICGTGDDR